jgi:hypothetical protein
MTANWLTAAAGRYAAVAIQASAGSRTFSESRVAESSRRHQIDQCDLINLTQGLDAPIAEVEAPERRVQAAMNRSTNETKARALELARRPVG